MSFPIGKGIMKELIVVWLISMDPRKKKYKVRDIIKTIETQMELGWSCGEKSQLLDNPRSRLSNRLLTTLITTPRGHLQWEPRKTKDEMEG